MAEAASPASNILRRWPSIMTTPSDLDAYAVDFVRHSRDRVNINREQMNGTLTLNRIQRSPGQQGQRRYWSGFSVCLVIVLLSLFTWMIHRRLTQYQSGAQAGGHHMTAIKVCLTERPQISVPAIHTMDDSTIFFVVIAFAGALFRLDEVRESSVRRDQPPRLCRTRIRYCVAYFFFLPPPASLTAL